jgi:hypothetical protein
MWRKMLVGAVALLVITAVYAPPAAASDDDDVKVKVHASMRVRGEVLDNIADFADQNSSGDVNDDQYSIWPYRARVSFDAMFGDGVRAFVEIQNFGYFGDESPFKSVQDPNFQIFDVTTFGEFGFGSRTNLYQGYIELGHMGGSDFTLRAGRQEHALGNELQMGDLDFYNGQSFDGIRGMFDWDNVDMDVFYYRINEQNAGCTAFCGSDNLNFGGVTATWSISDDGQVLEPYILSFRNGSDFGAFAADKANITTIGARYSRPVMNGDDIAASPFDWNIEAAYQTGDIGSDPNPANQKSSIIEGWFGWNWGDDDSRGRLHVGGLVASGDKEDSQGLADNGDHEDYLFLFPDFHAHNRLGDMDLETFFVNFADVVFGPFGPGYTATGITDYNVGYEGWWGPHSILIAYHDMSFTEDLCLYGPCTSDLGNEIDFNYNYRYSNHARLQLGIAQFSPGEGILQVFGMDDSAMRFWAQAMVNW